MFCGLNEKGRPGLGRPSLVSHRVAFGWLRFGKPPAATGRDRRALLDDFGHDACTDGAAAFADGEAQTVFHG
ncbi:hypothetical protein, partial [Ruegeria arenilitoris]|uniref:hypothetical protein n=1 Tax=Ruegeria arenilitoris TaxID=1173585 RepID=UPI0020C2EF55